MAHNASVGGRDYRPSDGGSAFGNTQSEHTYYDGVRRIQEVCTATPAGQAAETATREYVWGPGYVDEIVCQLDDGVSPTTLTYYLQDTNYNVVGLLDDAGNVLIQYTYTPYGELAAIDVNPESLAGFEAPHNAIGHQGLFFERFYAAAGESLLTDPPLTVADPAAGVPAGLYHNRNRWYSPSLGRFTTRDPRATGSSITREVAAHGTVLTVQVLPAEPVTHYGDGMQLYLVGFRGPLNGYDPLGLEWHHLYPMYLGGNADGPGIWLDAPDHAKFHNVLKDLLGGSTYESRRVVWRSLDETTRKEYLRIAADAAGVDVESDAFERALQRSYRAVKAHKHGARTPRGPIKRGNFLRVPRRVRGAHKYVNATIPGANKVRMIARGTAVASGVMAAAQLLQLTDIGNPHLLELARATNRARSGAGLSLWDEAFALYDFYELTGEPLSAGYAWTTWSEGL